jgi:sugar lactone lactonase YvrE
MGNIFPSFPQNAVPVLFNFESNTAKRLRGLQVVSQGDPSTELTQAAGGTCTFPTPTTVNGLPVTAYNPYTCSETYTGSGAYPGLRYNAIQIEGPGAAILASLPAYQTVIVGAQVVYPLSATITATGLKQPQALALSGLNKKLYIADTASAGGGEQGFVYSTNGPAGTALTQVDTGRQLLLAPSALAVDGAGNLFIADFDRGEVLEVPPGAPNSTAAINTGGLLQHPIALAFDFLGDLFIGDAGPAGVFASSSQPGFIVEIPVGGSAFQLSIPGVPVIFPQALAVDPVLGNLFIGDGGDSSGIGQVVELPADPTISPFVFPVNNVTNPTGLGFDAAEDLYILDGNNETLTSVAGAQLGMAVTVIPFDNSSLSAASALAVSAGGQSFVIANIGAGSDNNLLFLNGDAATLNFGNVTVGQSANATATISNIGNTDLALLTPYFTTAAPNPAFSLLDSSTCHAGGSLDIAGSCTMNLQFTPSGGGQTSETFNILSDGYNSGSTLTAVGTGAGGGNFRRDRKRRRR